MNLVEPIRNPDKVHELEKNLKKHNERDYIMFILGIYSGLRISDILRLRVRDVKGKKEIAIREKKTGKQRIFPINTMVAKELKKYCLNKDSDEFLIKSRKGYNKPIGRKRAYTILREAGEELGIYHLGTHTLRKTFGYHYYKTYNDIADLQKILNHSSPITTIAYIGTQKSISDKRIRDFKI